MKTHLASLPAIALRVATYNLSGESGMTVNRAQSQLLREAQVDVAGLQEINWDNQRFSKQGYNTLAQFTDFSNQFFGATMPFMQGKFGNAIVSQLPFETMQNQLFPQLWWQKTRIEPRAFQRVVFRKDDRQVAFYNTHLSYESESIRLKQMLALKKAVLADSIPYKIITGDFNVDQNTTDWRIFHPEFNLVNGNHGVWHDTFRDEDPQMKVRSIDNIILSANIIIDQVTTIDSPLSDHEPLLADLMLQ